jgi:polyphosphate kinase
MPRNLDRRVEVLFPVKSELIRTRIRNECLTPLALDNLRAYEMAPDGTYKRRVPRDQEALSDAQLRTWSIVAKLNSNGSMQPTPAEPVRLAD